MTGSFGDDLENEILDHIFGKATFTAAATLYIGFSTADPLDDESGIAEPTGNNYSRVAVDNNKTTWSTSSGGAISNAIVIESPVASGSWGTISHFFITDASSGAGIVYAHGSLGSSQSITSGKFLRFPVGDLDIALT
jgi:hypothetical protein